MSRITRVGQMEEKKVWHKPGEHLKHKNIVLRIKHRGDGGFLWVWGCMNCVGVCSLQITEGIMNQHIYMDTLENNLIPSLIKLGTETTFRFQQNNYSNHVKKGTRVVLKKQPYLVFCWMTISLCLSYVH